MINIINLIIYAESSKKKSKKIINLITIISDLFTFLIDFGIGIRDAGFNLRTNGYRWFDGWLEKGVGGVCNY